MQPLDDTTLEALATLICGDNGPVYRKSWQLPMFFLRAGVKVPDRDHTARKLWTFNVLRALNLCPLSLEKVILRLADPREYTGHIEHAEVALTTLREILTLECLTVEMSGGKPILVETPPLILEGARDNERKIRTRPCRSSPDRPAQGEPMPVSDQEVSATLQGLRAQLDQLISEVQKTEQYDQALLRLERWEERCVAKLSESLSPDEGKKFRAHLFVRSSGTSMSPRELVNPEVRDRRIFHERAQRAFDYLGALEADVVAYGAMGLSTEEGKTQLVPQLGAQARVQPRTVFIVHGHDETNALRLQKLLTRPDWNLRPIMLKDVAGKSRTIIEKFEQEGSAVAYAFVLMTPDDLVQGAQDSHHQARPNVLFEAGWFCGRLGRDKICLLHKGGTKLPSDLEGVERKEFSTHVNEVHGEIEKELRETGLL